MGLTIRLRQQGRKNRPFYRLVVADSRARRDGKYVEALGWYNPVEQEDARILSVNEERIQHWLDQGAQLTENAQNLVAKGAPEVIRKKIEKEQAHRAKAAAKQRARRKAAKSA